MQTIVMLPESWKQQISATFEVSHLKIRWFHSELQGPHTHHLHSLAEECLALAVDAADHNSRGSGCSIVVDDSEVKPYILRSLHSPHQSEIAIWNCSSIAETCQLIEEIVSADPSIPPRIRATVEQQELFDRSLDQSRSWQLHENQTFRPLTLRSAKGILAGSFNPLHLGHLQMREAAVQILEEEVLFELSLRNVEKPAIDFLRLAARSRQFSAGELLLTSAPTFVEKAKLFPKCTFLIGWDTAVRVLDPRFYPEGKRDRALRLIQERECRFLVAARRTKGKLMTLQDMVIPTELDSLFMEIPVTLFAEDISSTELREAWKRGETMQGPPQIWANG